jgi:molecular chaperone GrpE
VTEQRIPEGAAAAAPSGPIEENGPVIRDNRRVDPATGLPRVPDSEAPAWAEAPTGAAGPGSAAPSEPEAAAETGLAATQALAEERLADLQRLNAEFVNYRKRVERDRAVEYARGVADVVDALVPVLDDVEAARQHGDLAGPFAAIAEKLEAVLAQRFGVARYGEPGEEFDPTVHEALLHSTSEDAEDTSVSLVLQPGYRVGEKIVRAARVAVVGPE